MASNCSRGNKLELRMALLLSTAGMKFESNVREIRGSPDFVFRSARVLVFLDGDFWHGWQFPRWKHKLQPFWREKIERNRNRDTNNFRRLRAQGWIVIRIWEHQFKQHPLKCIERIGVSVGKRVSRHKMRQISALTNNS